MDFPFIVDKISDEQKKSFLKHFTNDGKSFFFEGVWFRNQREENKKVSGYIDENTKYRRYVNFYDQYIVNTKDNENYLTLKNSYVYVSSTYDNKAIEAYKSKIIEALSNQKFKKITKNKYLKNKLIVEIKEYTNHPKNKEANVSFPSNYKSLIDTVRTSFYKCKKVNDRIWTLSTKMYRLPNKRENPHYCNSINEIKEFLPAQVEMGCGPSLSLGIPPLFEMHETYKVQNHDTGKFYFASEDDLNLQIINDPEKTYKRFSSVPNKIIKAKPNEYYEKFKKLYEKGVFKGVVLNNNFDRILKRMGIEEYILRIYDKNKYLPKIKFDQDAKSLICIGTHADRRQVQKQAREQGKKIIYIDPEGFYNKNIFEPYPIEGPKDDDYILKMTFEEAIDLMEKAFLYK